MRSRVLLVAACFCLVGSSASALSDKPYLTAADVDFPALLPPPPTEASAAGARDLQIALESQVRLTPAQMDEIQRDLDQSVYTVAGPVLGSVFTKDRFPLAGAFFVKVVQDAGVGVGPIKAQYKKARPFQFSTRVQSPKNIADAAQSPTYPSGHSSTGAAVALLLGMMVPEQREALYARGWEYGFNRVRSGVAYPSDWEGGHILATLAVNQMLKNPDFRADFEAVKAEVRQGLGLR